MAKGPFGDLSGRQLIAGALAAMTSAWMASWLGVAGTLIGAAVGSVVAGIASALYQASIDRGIQRSKNLLTAEQLSARKSGKGGAGLAQDGEEQTQAGEEEEADSSGATSWKERLRRINWRSVAIASAATLLAAVVVIGAYEMITGKSYGRSSNPPIVPTSVTRGGGEQQTPNPTGQTPEQGVPGTDAPEEPTESAPTGGAPTTPAPTGGAPTGEAPAEPNPAPQGGGEGPTTP